MLMIEAYTNRGVIFMVCECEDDERERKIEAAREAGAVRVRVYREEQDIALSDVGDLIIDRRIKPTATEIRDIRRKTP